VKRIAQIGIGGYGAIHLQTIQLLSSLGPVELAAIADPFWDIGTLPEAVTLQTRRYRGFEELLAVEKAVDVLVISTPIPLHEPMLAACIERSSARILIEKPALPTTVQLERMIAADRQQRVRVAFQLIHSQIVKRLKTLLSSGTCGRIRRISLSSGSPRGDAYYSRATWAGRMVLEDGSPVFDGPATNAMAHLLHNAMFFCGEGENGFAVPSVVNGGLYRFAPIGSYDFSWIQADLGGTEFHAALAHCVKETVPFQVVVETEKGIFRMRQDLEEIESDLPLDRTLLKGATCGNSGMYEQLLAPDEVFSDSPTNLSQTRGYSALTCSALLSSGGVHDRQDFAVRSEGMTDVPGLAGYLAAFPLDPVSPFEAGFSWAASNGDSIYPGDIDEGIRRFFPVLEKSSAIG
jgi:predicted dehydrogenase